MPTESLESMDVFEIEKRAKTWDRLVTVAIVLLLFIPLPFARIEAWPREKILLEKPVTPWSQLRICCLSFSEGKPREEVFKFTWKGEVFPHDAHSSFPLALTCMDEPLLKWQKNPAIPLTDVFLEGDLVNVKTIWQPFLFWPLRMIWRTILS